MGRGLGHGEGGWGPREEVWGLGAGALRPWGPGAQGAEAQGAGALEWTGWTLAHLFPCSDGRMYGIRTTDGQKFSPLFYRTSSTSGPLPKNEFKSKLLLSPDLSFGKCPKSKSKNVTPKIHFLVAHVFENDPRPKF